MTSHLINFDQAFSALLGKKYADDMVEDFFASEETWTTDDGIREKHVIDPSLQGERSITIFMDAVREEIARHEDKHFISVVFSQINTEEGSLYVTVHFQRIDVQPPI